MSPRVAFIQKGWRTGGTAFMWALGHAHVTGYFDCLSPKLAGDVNRLRRNSTPLSWASGHPPEYSYWRTYRGMTSRGRIRSFPPEFRTREDHYFLEAAEPCPSLKNYLELLISDAQRACTLPAISFEAGDGITPWLKRNFADAIHIGVLREPEEQLKSWLRQAIQGAPEFFAEAHKIMKRWPEEFGGFEEPMKPLVRNWSASNLETVFWSFDVVSRELRMDGADFVVRPTQLNYVEAQEEFVSALMALGIDHFQSENIVKLLRDTRLPNPTAQLSLSDLRDAWDSLEVYRVRP